MAIDPYRTLGLQPGASTVEIKQAYRRLAKENHPDTAGDAAMPRFLAIRAAYDALIGPDGRRRLGGPARRSPSGGPPAPDAGRGGPAPPARPAWGGRPTASAKGSERSEDGGPRRPGRRADTSRPGASPPRGAAGPADEPGPGAGGPGSGGPGRRQARPTDRSRSAGSARPTDDRDRGGAGPAGAGPAGADGSRARRPRPLRKATLGSTSYDEADREPFDPEWGGASWYGTTSGTYWTINPKEYADPRKHGPEYQARARRRAAEAETAARGAEPRADASDHEPPDEAVPPQGPAPPPGEATWWDAASTDAGEPAWSAGPAATRAEDLRHGGGQWRRTTAGGQPPAATPGDPAARPWRARSLDELLGVVLDPRPGLAGRGFSALLGWPPIGLAIAWLAGELTGCARFAATCNPADPTPTFVVVLAQVVVVLALLAVPALARTAVGGSLGVLAAAIPIAATLSAIGAAATPRAAADVLGSLLVIAWAIGAAVVVRIGPRPPGGPPAG